MRAKTGVTRQAVLDYLIREADFDGMATIAEREIAEHLGVSPTAVSYHLHALAAEDVIRIGSRGSGGYKGLQAIHLSEQALS